MTGWSTCCTIFVQMHGYHTLLLGPSSSGPHLVFVIGLSSSLRNLGFNCESQLVIDFKRRSFLLYVSVRPEVPSARLVRVTKEVGLSWILP